MYFDSHTHYADESFDADRDDVLCSLAGQGAGFVMEACTCMADIAKINALTEKYPFIYASVGVHPHDAAGLTESDMDILKKAAQDNCKIRAVGEIGLDYYYDNSPRDIQKKWFMRQMELACELNLPVIIHDREAHRDTMDILKSGGADKTGGILHCFSGSVEMAREVLDLGMYIAFGGSLTFKKAAKPVEVAKYVPFDRIVIETDCPYLTPEPHRGKRNNSAYLKYVAEKLAGIKGISAEEIADITEKNAKTCFNIKD